MIIICIVVSLFVSAIMYIGCTSSCEPLQNADDLDDEFGESIEGSAA